MDPMLQHYANIFALTPLSLWVMDFTELVRGVDALKARGVTDWEAFFAENPHELWQLSAKHKILDINEHAVKMYGCESKESFYSSMSKFFYDESMPIFTKQVMSISRGEKFFQSEGPILQANGRRMYIMFATVLFDDVTADQVLGFSWQLDISERRAMEQELARSNQELEQFAYIVSHDLQEPLRMINSYTQMLGQRYRGSFDERANKYLGYVTSGAQRMKSLISDLLALSRLRATPRPPSPVDLSKVLEEVRQTLDVLIHENQARIVCEEALPTVLGDEARLHQLLQNLLSNAIKFRGASPPEVRLLTKKQGHRWVISVADNGIGISHAHHTKIFDPFKRIHSEQEYPGTGIGLTVVKKIVAQHGGEVWVESEEGKGSTFHVSLPDPSQAPVLAR